MAPKKVDSDQLIAFAQKLLVLLAFAIGAYFLWLLLPVIAILCFSGFLAILFSPFLDAMNKRRIPDWFGTILIFLILFTFLLVAVFAIVPIFVKQTILLFSSLSGYLSGLEGAYQSGGIDALGLPSFVAKYIQSVDLASFFEFLRSHASSIAGFASDSAKTIASGGVNIVTSLSGGILQGIMVVVFTFFITFERRAIRVFLYDILPGRVSKYLRSREKDVSRALSAWIRGQILLGLSIFALTFASLLILRLFGIHLDGTFTLALIAGLMEFIPYVGPLLALLPALAIAAGLGMTPVVVIFILYIAIQQAENNIVVPMVMSRALSLSPLVILLVMTALGSLWGIVGILLAIPAAAILKIAVSDFLDYKKGLTKTRKTI